MSQTASTKHQGSSSASALPLGRRVHVASILGHDTPGAIAEVVRQDGALYYEVRLAGTVELYLTRADNVRPVTPDPTPVSGDAYAERAAAEWVARSRGQLDVLDGSYNTGAYHALTEAGRDICRAIDAARAPKPCAFTWHEAGDAVVSVRPPATPADLFACTFTAEPGARYCGVHLEVVEEHGHPVVMLPREDATEKAAPIGRADPRRMLARESWNAPLPDEA